MTRSFFFLPLALITLNGFSQIHRSPVTPSDPNVKPGKATKSALAFAPLISVLHPDSAGGDIDFFMHNLEENDYRNPSVEAVKNSYPPKAKATNAETRVEETESINLGKGQQYDANTFDGSYPPDNNLAVSGSGWVVATTNSTVRYYNAAGQLKLTRGFQTFIPDGSLTDDIFDPKVLFDSGSNRFVFCVLHGSSSADSKILLMFSKSDNPQDGWNYYNIPISPGIPNRWADYPNIGVSNNEVYVTVNLFTNAGNFDKVALYQINKNDGYNANATIGYQSWTNISDDSGVEPFTLMPVSYGQDGNYGPGIFLVSNSGNVPSTRVQVFDLTDDLSGNPSLNGYHVTVPQYTIGSPAEQPQGDNLDIGDGRMKSAFYLNGIIHCVYTVASTTSGYNGVNYHRITVNPLSVSTKKYAEANTHLGYPSIASFSTTASDPTAVLFYDYSSMSVNPGCRAVICDNAMNFGTPLEVKTGSTYIDVSDPGTEERWGDYTGISRKPNSPYTSVWVYGIYGKTTSQFGLYGNNVCELRDADFINTGTPVVSEAASPTVFPNPLHDYFNVRFESNGDQTADVALYDAAGKLVKQWNNRSLHDGEYQLGFSRGNLPNGVYLLRVTSGTNTIADEKIVVQ